MLDVDLHGWTPVRDRGMGCRQYTPSLHATTPESNMSVRNLGSLRSTRSAMPAGIITVWAPASRVTIAAEGLLRCMTRVNGFGQLAWSNTSAIMATRAGDVRCGSASFSRLYLASAHVNADPS